MRSILLSFLISTPAFASSLETPVRPEGQFKACVVKRSLTGEITVTDKCNGIVRPGPVTRDIVK